MPNIRSANKNHKRTLTAQVARDKVARLAKLGALKPAKTVPA